MEDLSMYIKSNLLKLHKKKGDFGTTLQQDAIREQVKAHRKSTRHDLRFENRRIPENMSPAVTPARKEENEVPPKVVSKRLEMLAKWKAEKEKAKREQKNHTKPIFKVTRVTASVGLPNLENVNKEIKGKPFKSSFAPPNHKFRPPQNIEAINMNSNLKKKENNVSSRVCTRSQTLKQNGTLHQTDVLTTNSRTRVRVQSVQDKTQKTNELTKGKNIVKSRGRPAVDVDKLKQKKGPENSFGRSKKENIKNNAVSEPTIENDNNEVVATVPTRKTPKSRTAKSVPLAKFKSTSYISPNNEEPVINEEVCGMAITSVSKRTPRRRTKKSISSPCNQENLENSAVHVTELQTVETATAEHPFKEKKTLPRSRKSSNVITPNKDETVDQSGLLTTSELNFASSCNRSNVPIDGLGDLKTEDENPKAQEIKNIKSPRKRRNVAKSSAKKSETLNDDNSSILSELPTVEAANVEHSFKQKKDVLRPKKSSNVTTPNKNETVDQSALLTTNELDFVSSSKKTIVAMDGLSELNSQNENSEEQEIRSTKSPRKRRNVAKSSTKKSETSDEDNSSKLNESGLMSPDYPITCGSDNEAKTPSKTEPPMYISPFVTISRGKTRAREEYNARKSNLEFSPKPDATKLTSPEAGADYFSWILDSEISRLEDICDKWSQYKIEESPPEEAVSMIDVALGQTNLLITKKFEQFRGLIEQCRNQNPQAPVTCEDLHGFWDMMYIQVQNLDKRFENLTNMKSNNWQEVLPEQTKVEKKKKVKATKKVTASSALRLAIQAARKKKQGENETNIDVIIENKTPQDKRRSQLITSENKKPRHSSPGLMMMKVAQVAKAVDTPAKSILKMDGNKSAKKKVFFQDEAASADNKENDLNESNSELILSPTVKTPRRSNRLTKTKLF